MTTKTFRLWATIILSSLLLFNSNADDNPDTPDYETGFSVASRIGSELYNALESKQQKQVHLQPVALETDVSPFVKTVEYPDDPPMRLVFISIGFIDLMNNVSHAKAIEQIESGYFQKYILSLAQEDGALSLKGPPGIEKKKYWSDAVMNEQQSSFNQMVGMVVAIELSHHYLGHFKKYQDKLEAADNPVPINNLLTTAEWEASLKAGVRNALECGYGVDGLKLLYDSIDKMPTRPAWTAYFAPKNIPIAKLKKDLDKFETAFFQGRLK